MYSLEGRSCAFGGVEGVRISGLIRRKKEKVEKKASEAERTSFEVLPRLPRNVVVVPRQLAVEHPVLLVDPGDVPLVLVLALARAFLALVEAREYNTLARQHGGEKGRKGERDALAVQLANHPVDLVLGRFVVGVDKAVRVAVQARVAT